MSDQRGKGRHSEDSYRRQSENLKGSKLNRDRRALWEEVKRRSGELCEKCRENPLYKLIPFTTYGSTELTYTLSNIIGICQPCYKAWLKSGKQSLKRGTLSMYKLEQKLKRMREEEYEDEDAYDDS